MKLRPKELNISGGDSKPRLLEQGRNEGVPLLHAGPGGAVRKVVGIGGAISSTLRLSDQAARSIG